MAGTINHAFVPGGVSSGRRTSGCYYSQHKPGESPPPRGRAAGVLPTTTHAADSGIARTDRIRGCGGPGRRLPIRFVWAGRIPQIGQKSTRRPVSPNDRGADPNKELWAKSLQARSIRQPPPIEWPMKTSTLQVPAKFQGLRRMAGNVAAILHIPPDPPNSNQNQRRRAPPRSERASLSSRRFHERGAQWDADPALRGKVEARVCL